MNRICAVVPAYNRANFITDALDSIASQSRHVDELIVVDDGSTDDTLKIVHQWGEKNGSTNLKLLQQSNQGAASARNTAIRNTDADLIAPLDSDDVWVPDHVQLLEQPFIQHDDVVVSAGNTRRLDNIPLFKKTAYDEVLFQNLKYRQAEDGFRYIEGSAFESLLQGAFIQTSSCIFSRKHASEVGLFDDTLRSYEDQLFFLRLSRKGQFAVHMDPVTLLRRHDDNTTHRRHIASHIVCAISALEKAMADAEAMNLTKDELASLEAVLNYKINGAAGRASKYGIAPYAKVCAALVRRGRIGSLIHLKPFLRAMLRPRGDRLRLQRKLSQPAA